MALNNPNLAGFEWRDARRGLKDCIELIAPNATVESEWKLEFDPATGLGRVTPQMKGKNGHAAFVHSWFIGFMGTTPITTNGVENTIGGMTVDYIANFAVWGFFDYLSWRVEFGTNTPITDGSANKNATAFAEAETRALMAVLRANPTLGLNTGRIRHAYPLEIENSDTHPYSDGKVLIVVMTKVGLRIRESFA